MLVYLDALIAALGTRDAAEAERLLAHPLARLLPDEVRTEARTIIDGTQDLLAAPLRAMQLRHQTGELLRDAPALADRADRADRTEPPAPAWSPPPQLQRRAPRPPQMELPLSA